MNWKTKYFFIYWISIPIIVVSFFLGPSEEVKVKDVILSILNLFTNSIGQSQNEFVYAIVVNVRLPRVLLTFLVGAALSASGSAMQALFKNPLISPEILGLSSGAAFAMAYKIMPVQLSAFLFGLMAVSLSYFLAKTRKGVSIISLILSGIIISGIFTALLTILQFLTDPFKLQTIVHWTMGNLHNANWQKVYSSSPLILISITWLYLMRWRLNVIALGDEETKAVGIDPEKMKLLIIIPSSLAVTASIAVSGIIATIGLVIPHMVRLMVGPDNTRVLPVSMFFGGSFLLIVDNFSRTMTSFEIPIGIFTTLLCGPFFIYLLKMGRLIFKEF